MDGDPQNIGAAPQVEMLPLPGIIGAEYVEPTEFAQNPLTPRQYEILDLLSRGISSKAIARDFGISVFTVHKHKSETMLRLGANNMVHAVSIGFDLGFLSPDVDDSPDRIIPKLTPVEKDEIFAAARGLDSEGSAAERGTSMHTARKHRNNIIQKFGTSGFVHVMRLAREAGILMTPEDRTTVAPQEKNDVESIVPKQTPNRFLSPSESTVLDLVSYGLSAADIANKLGVSVYTIRKHQNNGYRKLKVQNAAGAVQKGFELGILKPSQSESSAETSQTINELEVEEQSLAVGGLVASGAITEREKQRTSAENLEQMQKLLIGAMSLAHAVRLAWEAGASLAPATETEQPEVSG